MLPKDSITAAQVVEADLLIRSLGERRAMRRLEAAEPELASYLMESATRLYARLDRSCASHSRVKGIHRDAVRLALVCVEAVRRSA